jgi:membrane protease YdiL (CAAX protease family)
MTASLEVLFDYALRIAPGVALLVGIIALAPRQLRLLRAVLYILTFVLIRDAMTPAGLWSFGETSSVFWLRFAPDAALLWFLAAASLVMAAAVWLADSELRSLVFWHRGHPVRSAIAGLIATALITAPWLAQYLFIPLEARGGCVAANLLLPIVAVTLAGNLLEEILFRGYFQGALDEHVPRAHHAALISGLFFGGCHAFLASTVTDVGWPLLLFATWEGVVVALLRNRYGLIASVVAHGLAVAILASALV